MNKDPSPGTEGRRKDGLGDSFVLIKDDGLRTEINLFLTADKRGAIGRLRGRPEERGGRREKEGRRDTGGGDIRQRGRA